MENGGHVWSDIESEKKLSFYPLVMMLNLMRGRKLCQSERESDKNHGQPMVIGKVKFPPPQKVQQNGKGWQFDRKSTCWADMLNHCVHWGRAMGLWKGGEVGPREGGFLHLAALQVSLAQATRKAVMKLSQKKRECDQHLMNVTSKWLHILTINFFENSHLCFGCMSERLEVWRLQSLKIQRWRNHFHQYVVQNRMTRQDDW